MANRSPGPRHPALAATAHRSRSKPYNALKDIPHDSRVQRDSTYKAGRVAEPTRQDGVISSQRFEDLLERDERVVVIESSDPAGTAQQFRVFATQTGKAIYIWHAGEGLTSLKVVDMQVPGSGRLSEALRYVANSKHYGIYGFVDFEGHLKMDSIQLLREIAKGRTGYERKVVLITPGLQLPESLEAQCARVEHQPKRHLRLRDGRWII